jgi:hypothetical protein
MAMACLADAAGMEWRRDRCLRERKESSEQREQQEKSGGDSLHGFLPDPNPEGSIEQVLCGCKPVRRAGRAQKEHSRFAQNGERNPDPS